MAEGLLDDADAMADRDPGGMLAAVSRFPEWWQEAYDAGRSAEVEAPGEPSHLVVLGMGGSGVTGDVVRAALAPNAPFPVVVVKGYELPAFVDRSSLVLAVSYSGETEETLDTMGQAMGRGAAIVGVSSGGRLAKACKARKWPWLAVPSDLQPRAALPWLSGVTLGFLDQAGLMHGSVPHTAGLADVRDALSAAVPADDNVAKQWAAAIHDAEPVVYGWGPHEVSALRFKCQLNENAKMFARAEPMPEANHNDMVAWGSLPKGTSTLLALMRSADEPEAIDARFRFLDGVARERDVPVRTRVSSNGDPVGAMLENILFGDFVSVYTAYLRAVDPTPVEVIHRLKASLAQGGRMHEAAARLGV